MKTVATSIAFASVLSAALAQSTGPIVQTPAALVQCQPALISFSGGSAPYYISVIPGGQAGATALEQFPTQTGNSYTWTVNIATGTSISLQIRDSTGAVNYSDQLSVQSSDDATCVGAAATGTGSSTSGAGATSTNASSAAAASTSNSARSSSAASSSSSSSAASSSAASSSAASSSMTTSARSTTAAAASTTAASGVAPAAASTTAAAAASGASGKYAASLAAVLGAAGLVAFAL